MPCALAVAERHNRPIADSLAMNDLCCIESSRDFLLFAVGWQLGYPPDLTNALSNPPAPARRLITISSEELGACVGWAHMVVGVTPARRMAAFIRACVPVGSPPAVDRF